MRKYFTDLKPEKMEQLEQIAMDADFTLEKRGGIDVRDNDSEDFPEISVWAIQRMLDEAYQLGLKDGKKRA